MKIIFQLLDKAQWDLKERASVIDAKVCRECKRGITYYIQYVIPLF